MKDKIKKLEKYLKENLWFYIAIILIIVIFNVDTGYLVYSPGGLINIDSRLSGDAFNTSGSLNLTFVTSSQGKIPNMLLAAILPNWDIIKENDVTYDNETIEENTIRNRIHLYESISNATYLAYKSAGKNVEIKEESLYISTIADYAETDLKIGDKIITFENKTINNFNDILNFIKELNFNDKINLKVVRNDKEYNCYAIIKNDNNEKKIGIGISKVNEYIKDPNINYTYKQNETGASGGLMLSLALYNALTEDDITNGKKISGTGTINSEGTVGEISGVKYKLAGAVKNKSQIFIVPADNYDEALKEKEKHHYKINLIKADTFEQVLEELKNIC